MCCVATNISCNVGHYHFQISFPSDSKVRHLPPSPNSSGPYIWTVLDTPRLGKCIGVGLFHGAGRKITFDA